MKRRPAQACGRRKSEWRGNRRRDDDHRQRRQCEGRHTGDGAARIAIRMALVGVATGIRHVMRAIHMPRHDAAIGHDVECSACGGGILMERGKNVGGKLLLLEPVGEQRNDGETESQVQTAKTIAHRGSAGIRWRTIFRDEDQHKKPRGS